ncbi:MAG: helix-turn-helix domain-containing protein [Roseburia sp.]|nr:helix-turn-helix domain-containing protein [Roseburia sp.]
MLAIRTIDMEKTGQNITNLRIKAGKSVAELQKIFGFTTPQAIYKWQHGTALPNIDNMVILASELGVLIDDLLVLTDNQISNSA